MSKIVVAVNAMISQKQKISSVQAGSGVVDGEVFFVYDNKHKWSIFPSDDDYILCFYPGTRSIDDYAQMGDEVDWGTLDTVFYRTRELGAVEALESFAELYSIVRELIIGMDGILDEIIASDVPF